MIDTVSFTVAELIALPEVEAKGEKELEWAIQFWAGLYGSRSERASLAFKDYDKAVDDEKSHAVTEQLWQFYCFLDNAAKDAGRMLDKAKAELLARRN